MSRDSNDNEQKFFSTRPKANSTLRKYNEQKRRSKQDSKASPSTERVEKPRRSGKPAPERVKRPRRRFSLPKIGGGLLIAAVTAIAVAVGGLWFFALADNSLEVFVDGESVGFISERDTTAAELTSQVSAIFEMTSGTNIRLDQTITVAPGRAPSADILSRLDMISVIQDNVTFLAEGFAIYVDGDEIGVLRTRESAENVLNSLVEQFIPDGAQLASPAVFVEEVTTSSRFMDPDDFASPEVMVARLSRERQTSQQHTIQPGENMSVIAARYSMTLDAIFNANPTIPPANPNVVPGQVVNVVASTPLVSVRSVEVSVATEEEPYGSDNIYNPMQASTFRQVVQPGRPGIRSITTHITRINGNIIGTEIVDETITQPPVNEIVEVGARG